MPLYDCVLLLKPHVKQEALLDLVSRVGKHVIRRNGVLTEIKSVGTVQLGYGIRKLDGRFYQVNLPLAFDSAYFHLKTMTFSFGDFHLLWLNVRELFLLNQFCCLI